MKYLIFFITLFALGSCSKPEESFIKIPSEFSISVQEEIKSTGERSIWLELFSTNSQYCLEDSLIYTATKLPKFLLLDILDTYKASSCFQRIFPLKTRIELDDFTDSLQVELRLGSASSIFFTILDNNYYYHIEINQGTGLIKKYDKTYKIPKNLIWGYAYQKAIGSTSEVLMRNFKKDIEYDCYTKFLPKGYYSYFSILENNAILHYENPGIAGTYLNFYYTHDKSESDLVNFFNGLASKYVDLVGYKINTGFGIEFKSN